MDRDDEQVDWDSEKSSPVEDAPNEDSEAEQEPVEDSQPESGWFEKGMKEGSEDE